MKHKGEIVKKRVKESGVAVTEVAKRVGVCSKTMYNKYHKIDLKIDFIIKVGKAIYHDFSEDFPELKNLINEDPAPYRSKLTLAQCREQLDETSTQLIEVLMENRELRKEIDRLKMPAHKSFSAMFSD